MYKSPKKNIFPNKNETEAERFNRYKKTLLKIIHTQLPNCKIYIFGSRARNDHSQGSDIDLALDLGTKIDSTKMYNIQDEMEESTVPLHVDLVDIHNISGKFKEEVLKEGILWKN